MKNLVLLVISVIAFGLWDVAAWTEWYLHKTLLVESDAPRQLMFHVLMIAVPVAIGILGVGLAICNAEGHKKLALGAVMASSAFLGWVVKLFSTLLFV